MVANHDGARHCQDGPPAPRQALVERLHTCVSHFGGGRRLSVHDDLKGWSETILAQLPAEVADGGAIGHSLSSWTTLTRVVENGRIEAHTNAAERAQRRCHRTQELPAPRRRRRRHQRGSDLHPDRLCQAERN
ncbi:MAG: hypothetical protein EOO27_21240 [Comamonadaceae bacterium]|nr:MAG: hypothetical protein EOO27_21240 [Comamonadaceae bacterium]